MTLTADQYLQISQGYAKAAADPYVSPESREAFANKAEWFDFLGRRERGALRSQGNAGRSDGDLTARHWVGELSYSELPSRKPLVMTLGLTGAALYLIGTLLFTNALNLFGDSDRHEIASQLTLSVVPSERSASVDAKATEKIERQFQPTAARPHPISSDQPPYQALPLAAVPLQQEELSSPSPLHEPIDELAAVKSADVLKVRAKAIIRKGPSTSAKKIRTVAPGTALQVRARSRRTKSFYRQEGRDPVS